MMAFQKSLGRTLLCLLFFMPLFYWLYADYLEIESFNPNAYLNAPGYRAYKLRFTYAYQLFYPKVYWGEAAPAILLGLLLSLIASLFLATIWNYKKLRNGSLIIVAAVTIYHLAWNSYPTHVASGLYQAAKSKNTATLEQYLHFPYSAILRLKQNGKITPLLWFIHSEQLGLAKAWVEMGNRVDEEDSSKGNTPLRTLLKLPPLEHKTELLRLILERLPKSILEKEGMHPYFPLSIAAMHYDDVEAFKVMLEAGGAAIDNPCKLGEQSSCIYTYKDMEELAKSAGNEKIYQYLLSLSGHAADNTKDYYDLSMAMLKKGMAYPPNPALVKEAVHRLRAYSDRVNFADVYIFAITSRSKGDALLDWLLEQQIPAVITSERLLNWLAKPPNSPIYYLFYDQISSNTHRLNDALRWNRYINTGWVRHGSLTCGRGVKLAELTPNLDFSVSNGLYNPLHIAVVAGCIELADYLISKNANVNAVYQFSDSYPELSTTPLLSAALLHDKDMVKLLLKRGAKAELSEKYDGATALTKTIELGRVDNANVLLDNDITPTCKDMEAVAVGYKKLAKHLIQDANQRFALLVQRLIAKGIKMDCSDKAKKALEGIAFN